MFSFKEILNNRIRKTEEEELAKLLNISPEAMQAFEDSYRSHALGKVDPDAGLFDVSAEQLNEGRSSVATSSEYAGYLHELEGRIVNELLAVLDGKALDDGACVQNEDLKRVPENDRPMLTGRLQICDIGAMSSHEVLRFLNRCLHARTEEERKVNYNVFRQGLDMLDLDDIMYAMLGMNRNNMGYWFPALAAAAKADRFFKIPETKIIRVPQPLLQLSRMDYLGLTPSSLRIADAFCMKAFNLDPKKKYFVKTGVFSAKFDFRNAKVEGEKEVRELGEYLLFISNQASMMASPLSSPSIYGAATTNEWVVREYIEDYERNPTIYKGLPLRTEYRFFVDFDTDEILGVSPYWRPDVMLKRFGPDRNPDSPHEFHDYIIYQAHADTIMRRYTDTVDMVAEHLSAVIPDVDLEGQWSLDIMQSMNEAGTYDYYLIDMATADTSALSDCVPPGKLKKSEECWIPSFGTPAVINAGADTGSCTHNKEEIA